MPTCSDQCSVCQSPTITGSLKGAANGVHYHLRLCEGCFWHCYLLARNDRKLNTLFDVDFDSTSLDDFGRID